MSQTELVKYDMRVFGSDNNPHIPGSEDYKEYEREWLLQIDDYLIDCHRQQEERIAWAAQ